MIHLQDSLAALKGGRIPPPGSMPSFEEIKELLGFNDYYEEEKRYTTTNRLSPEGGSNLGSFIPKLLSNNFSYQLWMSPGQSDLFRFLV